MSPSGLFGDLFGIFSVLFLIAGSVSWAWHTRFVLLGPHHAVDQQRPR